MLQEAANTSWMLLGPCSDPKADSAEKGRGWGGWEDFAICPSRQRAVHTQSQVWPGSVAREDHCATAMPMVPNWQWRWRGLILSSASLCAASMLHLQGQPPADLSDTQGIKHRRTLRGLPSLDG